MKAKFSPAIETSCQFGNWLFDPADGQLKSNEKHLRLQPRLSKLLSVLVANVDVLLTRDELIDILWRDKSVNDDALSRCIAKLRSALGDNRTSPIYIETIPKKGYRFIKPLFVEPVSVDPINTEPDGPVTDTIQTTTIQTDNPEPITDISGKKSRYRLTVLALSLVLFVAILFSIIKVSDSINPEDPSTSLKSALNAAVRVTADTKLEHQPALSNRGDKIAFSIVQDNRMIVKVISTSGALQHEIKDAEHHLYSATFSIDDQSLLIASLNQKKCTIFLYQLPSLQRVKIGNCTAPNVSGLFDWSPDGKSFSYVKKSNDLNETAIWSYSFNTKQHIQITKPSGMNVFDTRPKYSPDGKKLAFTRGTQSIRNIYLKEINSLIEAKPLTKSRSFITSFNWLNDNKHLVFDSNELGDRNLWLLGYRQ